jgi:hypothetical protein
MFITSHGWTFKWMNSMALAFVTPMTWKKTFGSTLKMKTPNNFLGVIMVVYGHDFFCWNNGHSQCSIDNSVPFSYHIIWRWGNTRDGSYVGQKSNLTTVPHIASKANKMKMLEPPSILACGYYKALRTSNVSNHW